MDPCPEQVTRPPGAGHSALGGEPRVKEGRSRASSHGYVRSQLVTSRSTQRKAMEALLVATKGAECFRQLPGSQAV
ncbi:hypothetical protein NEUTE2DRAFT_125385 [Neurospora tetrasperma FGSC 2509]|nr:hypothetical protein NEUTE2DRAFT_125385 [Neurospora tetrasperma FGSC 2509]